MAKTPVAARDSLVVHRASEHNLKNVSIEIPRRTVAVFTGVSGSGKSSLAYDTIFKEGQRRYLASLSSYARQFIQAMERPAVDLIEGLSPTLCIDQKSAGRNPRSTVGTITEIYDFLRLLVARLGVPHCPEGHGPIAGQPPERIVDHVLRDYAGEAVLVLAPVIRERKGEYRKELEQLRSQGFLRARIDGHVVRLDEEKIPDLGRYEKHTLEAVIDRFRVGPDTRGRLDEAVTKALALAEGVVGVVLHDPEAVEGVAEKREGDQDRSNRERRLRHRFYHTSRSCPTCGYSVPELEPRLFSFNVPQGACPECRGLGELRIFDPATFVADETLPLLSGALRVLTEEGNIPFLSKGADELKAIARFHKADLKKPWKDLPKAFRERVLSNAGAEKDGVDFDLVGSLSWLYEKYQIPFLEKYLRLEVCPSCEGRRLNAAARNVLFRGEAIDRLTARNILDLKTHLSAMKFTGDEEPVAKPVLREIHERLGFLLEVGLEYLTLDRRANTLSGGESQRIRLAAQVGSGLEGCLYILDEPSIGLHPSDNARLLSTLRTLRDRGNTVFVIEHDEDTMMASDHLVDLGPGAGVLGGEVLFSGPPGRIFKDGKPSPTRSHLSGETRIEIPAKRREADPAKRLRLKGAAKHNLKNLDVDFPLGLLTVVTGVSGSGKSTLVLDLFRDALAAKLEGGALPAAVKDVEGFEGLDKLIEIDQKPIGRTPRSNPATFTAAMDVIRDLFASLPESKVRGYSKGRFSFNVSGGRCEACGGAGVSTIDLQLFGEAEVVCEACDGKRFNPNTLDVHWKGKNIHQVLALTCEEAAEFFKDIPKLNRLLATLVELGLGYIQLGQPSTTLSGGEAQRIKLAAELGKRSTGKTVYVLDEPTTGLHFADIKKLLAALQALVEGGNTVVVIEHNLDVIQCADHVLELGPKGGGGGGLLLFEGTPEGLAKAKTATGKEMKAHFDRYRERAKGILPVLSETPRESAAPSSVKLTGVRKHNLKNIDVEIPKNLLVTITGRSGSGKTSLAFDTLFQEGQRKYVESLSTYARRFLGRIPRAEAERIEGIAPTIAVDQKAGSRNPRSTLATQTELYDSFRVLWAHLGKMHDPASGRPLRKYPPFDLATALLSSFAGRTLTFTAPLFDAGSKRRTVLESADKILSYAQVLREKGYLRLDVDGELLRLDAEDFDARIRKGLKKIGRISLVLDRTTVDPKEKARLIEIAEKGYEVGEGVLHVKDGDVTYGYTRHFADLASGFHFDDDLTPRHFSFNHHLGACPRCQGLGQARAFREDRFIEDEESPFLRGAMAKDIGSFFTRRGQFYGSKLKRAAREADIDVWTMPWKFLARKEKDFLIHGAAGVKGEPEWATIDWPGVASVVEDLYGRGAAPRYAEAFTRLIDLTLCPDCGGGRLAKHLLAVSLGDKGIHEVTALEVSAARAFFEALHAKLGAREKKLAGEVVEEIRFRLRHLEALGLHYLSLDRSMSTLSGGESQRVRLSTQIGNKLKDVIYVLDEPTIGLHERETEQLLAALKELRDRGNTVVLVEHDGRVIEASDWVVDLGPGAGAEGGHLMYQGDYPGSKKATTSFGPYLAKGMGTANRFRVPAPAFDPKKDAHLLLVDVSENNLKKVEVRIPVGRLTALSGVSGSGKSSLFDWFVPRITDAVAKSKWPKGGQLVALKEGKLMTRAPFARVDFVDQSPVTQSERSAVVSFLGIYDPIRDIWSRTRDAQTRGFEKGHFSYNHAKGRCATCEGRGTIEIEMHFLSDVNVPCDACGGRRYRREVLEVLWKGKSIADALDLTVREAIDFFESFDRIRKRLQLLQDTGLGYLKLGLPVTTLSGGELQRLKIAREIGSPPEGGALYLLDEPTTGLHFADTELLIGALDRLVQAGSTVVVIEHNRDFLRNADWLIDLGPEGGAAGGEIVACGTPEEVKKAKKGHTWRYL